MGSDNGLSPGRRHAIIWTNAGISLIRTFGTNFSKILSEIHTFSSKKMHLKYRWAKRHIMQTNIPRITNLLNRYPPRGWLLHQIQNQSATDHQPENFTRRAWGQNTTLSWSPYNAMFTNDWRSACNIQHYSENFLRELQPLNLSRNTTDTRYIVVEHNTILNTLRNKAKALFKLWTQKTHNLPVRSLSESFGQKVPREIENAWY